MTKREKMTIEVPAGLRDALAQWAAEEGRTLANLVRRLVVQGVERRRAGGGEAGGNQ